jgi:hypothetical protein
MVVARLEGASRDNIDSDAQEFLKILEQADVIKKGSAWFKINKQVKIAVWAGLSPSDRAKHRDPMSPALSRDAEDLRAAAAQPLKSQHVLGHPSRVSPRALATRQTSSEVQRLSGRQGNTPIELSLTIRPSRASDTALG